ncbi:Sporulation inhibitor A [Pelagirhabdus alkalitolerans]|uniref:Sporulation inhibitor A n=1 Tax=Pelagirhabdus alkalitolerans TaxID=1612202 RepID=A0A1G6GXJ6_9BACI|nr:sporulation histidine kinase inhibitor Sda [Pelagirhabdus alkalitolerans]SDB86633.1 Sporulation inhibitor A [Pelagirhabdus alkalitolerans]
MHHLSDTLLTEAIDQAIKHELDDHFISLLETERLRRGLDSNDTEQLVDDK